MKTYFKVVRNEDGKLKSLFDFSYLTVEYSRCNWIFPKVGRLFVFSTIEAAKFCKKQNELSFTSLPQKKVVFEIWEVEVMQPRRMKWGCGSMCPEDIVAYWLNWINKKSYHRLKLYSSVYGVKAVKLLRRIK